MKKPCSLKVRGYAAFLIELNDYLAVFLGENIIDKNFMTELNEVLLKIIPNSRSKQAYVQGFDCEYITFKIC